MSLHRHPPLLLCLLSSAICTLTPVTADAASDKISSSKKKISQSADPARPTMLGASAPTDEHITVSGHTHNLGNGDTGRAFGGGLMTPTDAPKSVSAVTRDYIAKQNPALNPMQLIQLLPGANVSDTDPLGMTGGHISVRGLTESQMGFSLEGFPINDIGNFAVYPQEIVDSENLKTVRLAQGSADLDSPHIGASGGVVDMYMIDPKTKTGGHASLTYGSYNSTRGFARFDTGYIGNTNLRAYFSYSQSRQDHWRGPGWDGKRHAEMKVVNDWGHGNRISLAIVGNSQTNYSYPNVSMASWKKWGTGFTNPVGSSGLKAGDPPNTVYEKHYVPGDSNYYKLRPGPFNNIYASMPSTFRLTDRLTLTETPYFWYGYGNGGGAYSTNMSAISWGGQTLSGSINGQTAPGKVMLFNPSVTETYRPGSVTKLTLSTGINRLMIGYWFEYAKQRQSAPYSPVGNDGTPINIWGDTNRLILSNGDMYQYRNTLTQTQVHTPFIGDSLSLLNGKLTIDAGFRYAIVTRRGTNDLPDVSQKYISQTYRQSLPTAAIRYKINDHNQIFASVSTSFRTPQNYALYDAGTYTAGAGYSTKANPDQRPEVSISEEAGWRYQDDLISSSLTYFHYNFTNRLFQQTQVNENGQIWATNINAGGQHSDGFDAEIGTRPMHHIRPYLSVEYLHAITDSNLPASSGSVTDYMHTKGKHTPQSPSWQVGFGLQYDDGARFIGFDLKYVARQYATFMNDQHIPGYVRMNINMGYRLPKFGIFKSPTIQLNLQNLSDQHYLNWINSPQVNATTQKGIFGNTIAGTSPNYTIASPFAAIATISSDF
ncbi:TonB-dependent receptor [Acetobacter sp. AN02]|uniref:TonB-dependent receptor n=1 Tax=Acetobacter sp. AN02 TaxID=2894186 RepID=UPI0024345CB2|nr:TonB-dependent receptor [Acetobacter sp. AN02]MDG6094054.1 TonB-dependent receptor [Acetobacter sp. AN02]